MSLVLIVSSVIGLIGGHWVGASALLVDALLAALSSFGILRRRRFGVVGVRIRLPASNLDWAVSGAHAGPAIFVGSDRPDAFHHRTGQTSNIVSLGCVAQFHGRLFGVHFRLLQEQMGMDATANSA